MENAASTNKGIVWREFAPVLAVVLNSLIWYTLIYAMFNNMVSGMHLQPLLNDALFGGYYAAIAFSAIIGATIIPRARRTGLALWIAFGAAMSALMVAMPTNELPINFLFSILLGASIGIGLPSALAYFADATRIEKRGIYGGITWGAVGFGILAVATLITVTETAVGLELLAVWRAFGLLFFVLLSKGKRVNPPPAQRSQSYKQILERRELILYLVPWIMFSLINFIQLPILTKLFGGFAVYVGFIEFAITGIFALIGGFFADRLGRKRIVITGFIILGINYAMLSLFADNPLSWYLFTCLAGAAWGLFAVVFFMTLWGDLAGEGQKEKYYIFGGLPYLLAGFLTIVIEPYTGFIQSTMSFSIASFFLFVAVLPLMYAPETLPETLMKNRDFKSYAEKALNKAMKEEKKEKKKANKRTEKNPNETNEESDESSFKAEENDLYYEEAQKLAAGSTV
jgi:MFS family permease